MPRLSTLRLIIGFVLAATSWSVSAQIELRLEGEPGHFIVDGQSIAITVAGSDFSASNNNPGLTVRSNASEQDWSLSIAAPQSQPLASACYERTVQFPFNDPTRPALDFFFDGRTCGSKLARFKVHEIVFDSLSGELSSLAVDFSHQCFATTAGSANLLAQLRVNSTVPFDQPRLRRVATVQGEGGFISEDGDPIGNGDTVDLTIIAPNIEVLGTQNSVTVASIDRVSSAVEWGLNFAAPQTMALTPQTYSDVQRIPFQAPENPGMRIDFDGRSCSLIAPYSGYSGEFSVLEYALDPLDGFVTQLSVDFQQSCSTGGERLLGDIRLVTDVVGAVEPGNEDVLFESGFETETNPLVTTCID